MPQTEPPGKQIVFPPFRLDLENEMLRRGRQAIALRPKTLAVLRYLLERPGQLVRKEELLEAVWPESYATDALLKNCIKEIRQALRDNPAAPRYVETAHRRGYRFVGTILSDMEAERRDGPEVEEFCENIEERAPESLPELIERPDDRQRPPTAPGLSVEDSEDTSPLETTVAPASGAAKRRKYAIALLAATAIAAVAFSCFLFFRKGPSAAFQDMEITALPKFGNSWFPVISGDGRYIAHRVRVAGQDSLWLRQVGTASDAQIVPPSELVYSGLSFSPDDSHIYFTGRVEGRAGKDDLYRIPLLGGTPQKLIANVMGVFAPSPDGTRIAFARADAEQGGEALMMANADGTGEQKLTARQNASFTSLSWSPDGDAIAFSTFEFDVGDRHSQLVKISIPDAVEEVIRTQKWRLINNMVWLADGSGFIIAARDQPSSLSQLWHLAWPGGEARRITNDINNYSSLSISRDSRYLVAGQIRLYAHIWVVPDGDSDRARQITTSGGNGVLGLTWTPDGRVVYASNAGGGLHLFSTRADGTDQKQLTFGPHLNEFPSASPDGRYIVFQSTRASAKHIWRMDADGGNPRQLTFGRNDQFPQCLPGGEWVVYDSSDPGKPTVWKVPIDGGAPTQLTDKNCSMPAASPDGRLITCTYLDEKTKLYHLAGIPFEGGQPVKMFDWPPGLDGDTPLRWMLGGGAVVYAKYSDRASNLWSQPLRGGAPKPLTSFTSERIYEFDWSPDGKQLAVARGGMVRDAVLISNFK